MSGTTRALAAAVLLLALGNAYQWRARQEPPPSAAATSDGDPADPEAAIEAFIPVWVDRVGYYADSRYLGIETLQNPMDAWVTLEIIQEVKPDVVVEAGTNKGGSALLWATVLKEVNPEGRVITIDVKDMTRRARKQPLWDERITFLLGSSTAPEIVEAVRQRVEGKKVVVILDSLHSGDHVYGELRAYAPMVDVGSYVIVQDTGLWKASPNEEWASEGVRRFLREDDRFEIDRARERFVITNNPDGYLRRVR